jgi:hypothetical protein
MKEKAEGQEYRSRSSAGSLPNSLTWGFAPPLHARGEVLILQLKQPAVRHLQYSTCPNLGSLDASTRTFAFLFLGSVALLHDGQTPPLPLPSPPGGWEAGKLGSHVGA